jgi:hypothetical protein
MQKTKRLISATALTLVAVALSITTSGVLSAQKAIPNSGIITSASIEVYEDNAATQICQSIDWGNLNPDSTATQNIYVKNPGHMTETLHMNTLNWSPSPANSTLSIIWDKEGATLSAGTVVAATLKLQIAEEPGNLTDFNCNVIVQRSE